MADTSHDIEVKADRAIILGAVCGFVVSVSGIRLETALGVGGAFLGAGALSLSILLLASFLKDVPGNNSHSDRVLKLAVQWSAVAGSYFLIGITTAGVNWILYRLPGKYLNWISVGVLPLGYLAHQFKQRRLRWYGIVEILVGFATALGAMSKGSFQPTQGLALIGATYVVARGFNNVADARRKNSIFVKAPSA